MNILKHALATSLICLISMTLQFQGAAHAQETTCTSVQFATMVDDTGKYLRNFSLNRKPILHEKLEQLARTKGWASENAQERGYQFVQDKKTVDFDARARKLLIELDRIDAQSGTNPSCTALQRLKSVTLELRAITEAKFMHMMKRADQALRKKKPQPAAKPVAPKIATLRPKPTVKLPPWQTKTKNAPSPAIALRALQPPEPMPVATTYTADEIRLAGRGFFGNLSANLASVIQYTFENYGAPNGYILGTEGGGAFLAGLSFGKGKLNTKMAAPLKVFWQGPTVGYDLGLQGSRVMFLIYNLKRPEKIFARYAGIGGSAYIVGGVGLTYHKRGKVVLAPIRTGLGLRLGANIGYLKFTPRLSINPF